MMADFGTAICRMFSPICLHKRGMCPIDGIKSRSAGCACSRAHKAVVPISSNSIYIFKSYFKIIG